MADLLQTTITVKGSRGDSYTFAIPGIHDEVRIGARMKDIRRKNDPTWDGFEQGLDGETLYTMRAAATFETLLRQSDAKWPFSPGPDGGPIVDSAKFPADKVWEVTAVYAKFQDGLRKFREAGVADPDAAGAQAVAGEPDTGGATISG